MNEYQERLKRIRKEHNEFIETNITFGAALERHVEIIARLEIAVKIKTKIIAIRDNTISEQKERIEYLQKQLSGYPIDI
jgi:hypothetical protein